eukprot:1241778-Pyramimonas_sp.AAC.1
MGFACWCVRLRRQRRRAAARMFMAGADSDDTNNGAGVDGDGATGPPLPALARTPSGTTDEEKAATKGKLDDEKAAAAAELLASCERASERPLSFYELAADSARRLKARAFRGKAPKEGQVVVTQAPSLDREAKLKGVLKGKAKEYEPWEKPAQPASAIGGVDSAKTLKVNFDDNAFR